MTLRNDSVTETTSGPARLQSTDVQAGGKDTMSESEDWEKAKATLEPKIAQQVEYIKGEFAQRSGDDDDLAGIDIGVATSGQGVAFMYAEGQILVRDGYLERVQNILAGKEIPHGYVPKDEELRDWPEDEPKPVEPLIEGVVVLQF